MVCSFSLAQACTPGTWKPSFQSCHARLRASCLVVAGRRPVNGSDRADPFSIRTRRVRDTFPFPGVNACGSGKAAPGVVTWRCRDDADALFPIPAVGCVLARTTTTASSIGACKHAPYGLPADRQVPEPSTTRSKVRAPRRSSWKGFGYNWTTRCSSPCR